MKQFIIVRQQGCSTKQLDSIIQKSRMFYNGNKQQQKLRFIGFSKMNRRVVKCTTYFIYSTVYEKHERSIPIFSSMPIIAKLNVNLDCTTRFAKLFDKIQKSTLHLVFTRIYLHKD